MGRPKKFIPPKNPNLIKVDVTQKDILKGKVRNEQCCPVALATNRAFDGLLEGQLSIQGTFVSLRVSEEELERTEQLPFEAVSFIKRFDANEEVEPFSFELDTTRFKIKATK